MIASDRGTNSNVSPAWINGFRSMTLSANTLIRPQSLTLSHHLIEQVALPIVTHTLRLVRLKVDIDALNGTHSVVA